MLVHQLQSIPWLSFPKKKALRKAIQSQLDNESTNISEVSILWKNPWQVLGSFHYEDISQSSIQESIEKEYAQKLENSEILHISDRSSDHFDVSFHCVYTVKTENMC